MLLLWSPPQPHPLQPQTRLQWKRCADPPCSVGIFGARSVRVGGKVYVGAGAMSSGDNAYLVCQYDPERDGWATLPLCLVKWCALGQFQGHIITVGGVLRRGGVTTNKLHRYQEESQEWEEFLLPMPTARLVLSVISTQSAIIACGGKDSIWVRCATVEVYTVKTSQWYATDPLPIPCCQITSVTIADTCYLLGGSDDATAHVLSAPISSLIEKSTSRFRRFTSAFSTLWKPLQQDTPLNRSTAACLSGCLLAVGGHYNRDQESPLPDVHMLHPQTNSWVRMTSADLPVAVSAATAVELPDNKLLVGGGYTAGVGYTKYVHMASITHN